MNKRAYSPILDHLARDRMAANTDLAPRILARIQKGKRTTTCGEAPARLAHSPVSILQ